MSSMRLSTYIKRLLVRFRLHDLIAPVFGGAGAVLVFHRVRHRDPDLAFAVNHRNSVPPERFCNLLDLLAAEDIAIVSLDEALSRLRSPGARRFVCLTFDDGYRDNNEILLPIVRERRIPITIYIAPGLLDGSAPLWWYGLDIVFSREKSVRLPLPQDVEVPTANPADKEAAFAAAMRFMLSADAGETARVVAALPERYGIDFGALAKTHMMTWNMVRELAACPLVEIGAHSVSHLNLARLGEAQARREMAESRARLEVETGRAIRHLAYPFGIRGAVGPRELRLAQDLGFSSAVTTAPGNLTSRLLSRVHAWPRHGVGPDDGPEALQLKLAGVSRALFAR
jgi:peptidoglycan/xylan/chitin deacetylase (PgdA/CDA1 family)